jgi:hypothetical protein
LIARYELLASIATLPRMFCLWKQEGTKPQVSEWIASIGLDAHLFGTHSLRRIKATLIYRRTGNLTAVQLLPDRTKIESTVRYLGIEVDDAVSIAKQVEI